MGDLATTEVRGGRVEGSVERRLELLGRVVPPPEIGELWVFPPLAEVDASAEFFLFTRIRPGAGERRGLYSARMLPDNGSPGRQVVVEHGSVPADRMPRLVGRLQRRLGEEHQPLHVVIDGLPDRWEAFLSTLRARNGGAPQATNGAANGAPHATNGAPHSRHGVPHTEDGAPRAD